jgi:hypothetical protein
MGNCNFKIESIEDSQSILINMLIIPINVAINKSHFKFMNVVGKGGFGKVINLIQPFTEIYVIMMYRFGR